MAEMHAEVRRRMEDAGHVYTRGRQAVVDTLAAIGKPATIPGIMAFTQDLVQSSLYRNLGVLEQAGVVTRVDVGEGRSYFELSEQVTDEHHHHLVCRECSAVVDIALDPDAEHRIERLLDDAADVAGFALTEHRIDLVGVCAACRAA